jgi:SHS2 domain-containing protein
VRARPVSAKLSHVSSHRFVEHIGEVEVELESETEAGLFAAATDAFAELVSAEGEGPREQHEIALDGDDRALLLVDWLNELVYLAEVDGFVPERLASFELGDGGLRATVAGRRDAPPHLVKAVTLNDLEFAEEGGTWYGRVVLDV